MAVQIAIFDHRLQLVAGARLILSVADTALFLCSRFASAITGEVVHVDAGYNIMAV